MPRHGMSTQPEPATEAGRELLDRQSDPDWMDLDYAPKLAAIVAIEQEATAAARAEVARLRTHLRNLAFAVDAENIDAYTEDVQAAYRAALWEDAAPRPKYHLTTAGMDAMNAALQMALPAIYSDDAAETGIEGDVVTILDVLRDNGFMLTEFEHVDPPPGLDAAPRQPEPETPNG